MRAGRGGSAPNISMNPAATRIFDFLAPSRLIPLPLEIFGVLYAVLIAQGSVLFINDWPTGLWLHQNIEERTARTYGGVSPGTDKPAASHAHRIGN